MSAAAPADRRRHPSARSSGAHLAPLARRIGRTLPGIDGPHRDDAAAALAVRGRQGRSVASFAAAYGLDEALVAEVERGAVARAHLPAPLVVLTELPALVDALAPPVGG